jgi:hypothetical protein
MVSHFMAPDAACLDKAGVGEMPLVDTWRFIDWLLYQKVIMISIDWQIPSFGT